MMVQVHKVDSHEFTSHEFTPPLFLSLDQKVHRKTKSQAATQYTISKREGRLCMSARRKLAGLLDSWVDDVVDGGCPLSGWVDRSLLLSGGHPSRSGGTLFAGEQAVGGREGPQGSIELTFGNTPETQKKMGQHQA